MRFDFGAELAAPPADVMHCYAGVAFYDALARQMGVDSHGVDLTGTGEDLAVRWVRHLGTGDIPALFRRLVGPSVSVVEQRSWRPTDGGGFRSPLDVTADVKGRTARVTGELTLTRSGPGSRLAVEAVVDATVPLIGRQVRDGIAELTRDFLADEVVVLTSMLQPS